MVLHNDHAHDRERDHARDHDHERAQAPEVDVLTLFEEVHDVARHQSQRQVGPESHHVCNLRRPLQGFPHLGMSAAEATPQARTLATQSLSLHCGQYWLPIHYLVRVAPVVVSMTWLVAMANTPATFVSGD